MKNKPFSALLLMLFLGIPSVAHAEIKTGYFIDSPVTGLYYQTSSQLSGTTNKGAFEYRTGDVVRFFLGTDENGYLISTLSGQEVVTPTLATTTPSKSINLTRLLLSLDSSPSNRDEITLASKMLSNVDFQQRLKQIDLNVLDSSSKELNIDLVSVKEAVEHLNLSQQYIEDNFTSDDIIYEPVNKHLKHIIIKKKDWQGRMCAYDIKYQHHPRYRPSFGNMEYTVTNTHLIQYPSAGDYFNGCELDTSLPMIADKSPISEFEGFGGMIGCAPTGCTRNDLNGFTLDDYNDEGDWKYRTIAMNFDPETELMMEKIQGLGPNEHVRHQNRGEQIAFIYPIDKEEKIPFEGIWQQTQYHGQKIEKHCLLVKNHQVLKHPKTGKTCSQNEEQYTLNVTKDYADMWWVNNKDNNARLEQMNLLVRWYLNGNQVQHTTWEYLPAGRDWKQGVLYRYRQTLQRQPNGIETMDTFSVSEFSKI
ncbi:chromosome partitioning protein ParA [Aliivibrio fischeri]|uniref:chromosome partitioning protein ParA n=1 Tax=Aliivibrio fischeri TaxID=668 RepID=UPI0012D8B7BB|nr:chromosome partitioning protein ParA [Aliivibrio fischeri]MUK30723.1 chromosome partitioning protein ParA [Aliivibrio fischeri]